MENCKNNTNNAKYEKSAFATIITTINNTATDRK